MIVNKVSKAPSSVREALDAIRAFENFLEKGLAPGIGASLAALKACIKLKDLRAGARVHGEITKTGEILDIFVANTVVDMYAKCGSISDARRAFESIPRLSVVSWNSIIKGYAQRGEGEVALGLFSRMQERGFKPNAATFVSALKACTSLASGSQAHSEILKKSLKADCLSKGGAIHNQIRNSGLEANLHVASSLVDMYSKCGDMLQAKQVFDSILHHDVVLWNSLIAGYAQAGDGEAALQAFTRMQEKGFTPNARTLTAALNACSSLATREEGTIVQGKLVKVCSLARGAGIQSQLTKLLGQEQQEIDIILASALLDMYVKCGSILEAKRVFDQMSQHDVVSWTTLIMGYAQSDQGELALQMFSQMQTQGGGVSPNELTFVAALEACIGMVSREETGGLPEPELRRTCLEKGRKIHSQLTKKIESHPLVASTLVDMYSKCGSVGDARKVFDRSPHRDLQLWNAMLRGYSQCGEPELALQIYSWMRDEGCSPVALTFVSALKACGALADLQSGRRIHTHIRDAGLVSEEAVANSLISFYGKCSSLPEAHRVFDSLKLRGLVAWNALMSGYAHHGDAKRVFDLFQRMVYEKLHPSSITFTCILTACSHAGLVEKGKEFFDSMRLEFGITPKVEHYSCMVDVLGRANHLREALEMVRTMPVKPSLSIWRSLLAASRKWRDVETAKLAFDSIVAIEERDAAAYSVMASIYAAAGMREENLRIQNMRHSSRAWKQPGQSWWIDEKGLIHRFYAGDLSHPQSSEILEKLREVAVKMKEAGYEPVLGVLETEKESNVCWHSEKLAIGCALVNSAPGTTIYISKNLRACENCHRATGMISSIEKRKVVCRDATRFHVFTDGVCSCGDFW